MEVFFSWYYDFHKRACEFSKRLYKTSLWHLHQLYLDLLYFLFFSTLGFVALRCLETGNPAGTNRLTDLDLFFMSASATTASSLASVNMEDFNNSQFWVLTFLMFVGGEIFLSAITLLFNSIKFDDINGAGNRSQTPPAGIVVRDEHPNSVDLESIYPPTHLSTTSNTDQSRIDNSTETGSGDLKARSMKCLVTLVLVFYMFVNIVGSLTVLAYFTLISSARSVLEQKNLNPATFSVFSTVSSFVNCGFLPNNENMIVFVSNSGFLLLTTAQILVGNTLFPLCLTILLWALKKSVPLRECEFLWKRGEEIGYTHLFQWKNSVYLALSNVGFALLQFVMFVCLQWGSVAGMSGYRKVVAGIFQSVNARHAGEMAFDLSSFASALLVVYVVMMFLPPYTFFLPLKLARSRVRVPDGAGEKKSWFGGATRYVRLPLATYVVVFVVLLCLTERSRLRDDPLNFNVLSIAFEVASAYGNVGLTMGYSCQRLHNLSSNDIDTPCQDNWASLSGRFSWKGKLLILVVMFFGRLKKFARGGSAWITAL